LAPRVPPGAGGLLSACRRTSSSGEMPVPRAAAGPLLQGHGGIPAPPRAGCQGLCPTLAAAGTRSSPLAAPGLSADQTTPVSTIGAMSRHPSPAETLNTSGEDTGRGVSRDPPGLTAIQPRALTPGNVCTAGCLSHH